MLYAGAALMIGASIYGFVDYRKTSHKKEFSGMYKENKPVEKTGPVKKEISADQTTTNMEAKKDAVLKENGKAEEKTVLKKKKRNFRISEFSRAPLRDEEEKVILDEQDTKKPDAAKTIDHIKK
jgi:hypothetical protein